MEMLADSPNKSRLSVADPVAILSMLALFGNLLNCVVDPACRRFRVGQHLGDHVAGEHPVDVRAARVRRHRHVDQQRRARGQRPVHAEWF